jgi:hypothetical protein
VSYEIPDDANLTENELYAGRYLNNQAAEGRVANIKRVSANTQSAPGTTRKPDFKFEMTDGTTQYGDLYEPTVGKKLNNMMSEIGGKGSQTAGGTVVVRIDGSSYSDAEIIAAVRSDVFGTPSYSTSRVILMRGASIVADLLK